MNPSSHPYSEGMSQSILSQMLENRKRKLEAESYHESREDELPAPVIKKAGKKLRSELMSQEEEESANGEKEHRKHAPSDNFSEFEYNQESEE